MCVGDINEELGERLSEYMGISKIEVPQLLIA